MGYALAFTAAFIASVVSLPLLLGAPEDPLREPNRIETPGFLGAHFLGHVCATITYVIATKGLIEIGNEKKVKKKASLEAKVLESKRSSLKQE